MVQRRWTISESFDFHPVFDVLGRKRILVVAADVVIVWRRMISWL